MARMRRDAGIYVHVPYCLRKCRYCDFASVAVDRGAIPMHAYVDAVLKEAHLRAAAIGSTYDFTSIYFGGGTPSLLDPECVGRLLGGLKAAFGVQAHAEVTLECNPSSLDAAKASELVRCGVTRLSVGVQSMVDSNLALLSRIHDAASARRALRAALDSSATRVSADVIIGLPGQASTQAVHDVREVASIGPGHLSVYLLSVEPGTALASAQARGQVPAIDEGQAADAYRAASDVLTQLGFEHYEVSNFARPGQRSVHNTTVWSGGIYVGLGPGAVGMMEDRKGAVRYRNQPDPQAYMQAMERVNRLPWNVAGGPVQWVEELDAATRMRERIMLGLRVAEGVDLGALEQELGVPGWTDRRRRAVCRLQARGRLVVEGDRIRIPRQAWLWEADTVARLL